MSEMDKRLTQIIDADAAARIAELETANGILQSKIEHLDGTLRKFQELHRKAAKEVEGLREENFELRRQQMG